ncbi:hypothetical protein SAMN05216548_13210 [Faunimonas pinastri]|uniref:Uncharacterized protein n=1 Tax=Faunimonas pinastri TaxID=1855383 RepID=A0A1H9QQJ8_9HYPH|nr:hypothetical protein [Faunimonas pinastri]SER62776.1 hypothetical protein SAMN05216548_13210 [Faunimonas pinastri]
MTDAPAVTVIEEPDAIAVEIEVPGLPGQQGPVGPANVLKVGTLVTGEPGSDVQITIEGDVPEQLVNFQIPAGKDGTDGRDGTDGSDGKDGTNGKDGAGVVDGVINADKVVLEGTEANGYVPYELIATEDDVVVLGMDEDLRLSFTRNDETEYDDEALLIGGYVGGFLSADGRPVLAWRDDGTVYLRLASEAVGDLVPDLKLFPSASEILGAANPFNVRREAAVGTLYRFNDALETGWKGNPYPTVMEYLQRKDVASTTAMRAALGAIEYLPSTGTSTATGTNGSSGAKVVDTTPPAVLVHSGFGFPPDPSNAIYGTGAHGAGNNLLTATYLTDLVPLQEAAIANSQQGETSETGMVAWLCTWRDKLGLPWKTYVGRAHGAPGKSILEVSKGQNPFSNAVVEIKALAAIATKYRRTVNAPWVRLLGQEHDREYGIPKTTVAAAAGDATIAVDSTSGIHLGELVSSDTGIPSGATIASYVANTSITISAALTAAIPSGTQLTCAPNLAGVGAFLSALQAEYAAAFQSATGQISGPVIAVALMDAPCLTTGTPPDGQSHGSGTAQAIVDWVRANPDISRITHSRYVCLHDTADGANANEFHFAPQGYILDGEYSGKARLVEDVSGSRWVAYGEFITVTRLGTTVKLRIWRDAGCTVPWGGANFDTATFYAATQTCEAVPDGHYGFRYMVAGVNVCTGVAIAGDQVAGDGFDITISQDAAGQLDYAYMGPGSATHASAWGNCFDGGDTINGVTLESRQFPGLVLKNPLITFKAAVA